MNARSQTLPGHDALQARLGAGLAGLLHETSAALPHDIGERLRFAREQAVIRARPAAPGGQTQTQTQTQTQIAWRPAMALTGGRSGAVNGQGSWWRRGAALLPLLALLAGLVLIEHWTQHEQMLVAAEIDAQLLADALPPHAYGDPGFAEFLRTAPQ